MKPVKLTSLIMMLLLAANVAAQEEFFDDVYFSSKSKKNKVQQVESKKVEQPKLQSSYQVLPAERSGESQEATSVNGRDVDEYNRRYSGVEVEEPYREDEQTQATPVRRSDNEYTQRIVRYHSPSKVTIAGADQVDLYLSDGYYGYDYDTDYSDGRANVSLNINVGNGWGSPWYAGWYDPWFYGYNPWWRYSYRYYGPYWRWGWGG